MKRRDFLAASTLAGAATLAAGTAQGAAEMSERQYFEWRKYYIGTEPGGRRLNTFLEEAAIPALNRLGIGPVGVFRGMYGSDNLTLHVLLPHNSIESVVTMTARLLDDAEFQTAGADLINTSLADAAYLHCDSSLMLAFKDMPKLEAPDTSASRIFELRRYSSHSVKAGQKKISMFNEGKEIAIFRKTGLHPVFFGESLIGPNLPNLTYMLTFKDMAERDANWRTFIDDPEWKAVSSEEQYKDTVSNILDIILRPQRYSQI